MRILKKVLTIKKQFIFLLHNINIYVLHSINIYQNNPKKIYRSTCSHRALKNSIFLFYEFSDC